MDIRFVNAVLDVAIQPLSGVDNQAYEKEYRILSDFEEDSVGKWLKLAKARGETADSDEVVIKLLVQLHKKVDELTSIVKNEKKELLPLSLSSKICKIGFEHFMIEDEILKHDKEYYCRVSMPVFPKREMPMFIKAVTPSIGEIVLLHELDSKDWNAYVTARERAEIREMRAKK